MGLDFTWSAPDVARALIGCELLVDDEARERGGIIIETEAYARDDPASHSFRGQTLRNAAMFMPAGTLYMYQIYGLHYCLNIVCGNSDGQAVLIRALRPTKGLAYMEARRGATQHLTDGPAKLVQALGLDKTLNTTHLDSSIISLTPPKHEPTILQSSRIGVTKATDVLWRFYTS